MDIAAKTEAKKRILAIHAHPDDTEFLAGGTLALLAARGHSLGIVTMTPGDCGSAEHSAVEISAIRRREASSAAAQIGAEYHCAEFRDLAIFNDDDARRRVVAVIREFRPDLVLTAPPVDYLCDHETTSVLVRDALFIAPVPNYVTRAAHPSPPLPAIPHLYYMNPAGNVDREGVMVSPGFVVNIESVFEKKKAMLAQHESQRNWLRKHHGVDEYLLLMERWSEECGRRAGVRFGEGFRQYKGHPYPESPLLEELLGPELVVRPADREPAR
jgi:LmbE family N-acetylglucosaminyl deacetylase